MAKAQRLPPARHFSQENLRERVGAEEDRKSAATGFLNHGVPVSEMVDEVERNGRRIADNESGERDQRVRKRYVSTNQEENP